MRTFVKLISQAAVIMPIVSIAIPSAGDSGVRDFLRAPACTFFGDYNHDGRQEAVSLPVSELETPSCGSSAQPNRPSLAYRDRDGDFDGEIDGGTHTFCMSDAMRLDTVRIVCFDRTTPTMHALSGGDCDDGDASRSRLAVERCDGVDNDCNGLVDDGVDCATSRDPLAEGREAVPESNVVLARTR